MLVAREWPLGAGGPLRYLVFAEQVPPARPRGRRAPGESPGNAGDYLWRGMRQTY